MSSERIQPRTLRGFRDYLPSAMIPRERLIETARSVYRSFGFQPIDTPALEYTEILLGKGGAETDKQLYRFEDHGGRDVGLRFDLTVPLARFVAQHSAELGMPFKRYHIGPVWRGEKSQRGRYREFLQCDFDTIGTTSLVADTESALVIHAPDGRAHGRKRPDCRHPGGLPPPHARPAAGLRRGAARSALLLELCRRRTGDRSRQGGGTAGGRGMTEDVRPMEEVLAAEEPEFAQALEAVLTADTSTLAQLLEDDPELAGRRSSAHHESTLLHYVAANGVETALQVSPGTIYQFLATCSEVERTPAVERALNVPKLLLDAGAEVDAVCRTYGGGPHQTTLNLLVSSAHPHNAGVQETLTRVLVQAGAAVDGLEDDQSPLLTALAFGYWRTVAALVDLGARCDGLIPAAASGQVELVEIYFPDGTLKADVGGSSLAWFEVAKDPSIVAQQALVYASLCGHEDVVRFLLERGVDVDAIPPGSHVTAGALHTAALGGHRAVVECLLEGGADPTKREPRYGGDPPSWAEHGGDEEIVKRLREAAAER